MTQPGLPSGEAEPDARTSHLPTSWLDPIATHMIELQEGGAAGPGTGGRGGHGRGLSRNDGSACVRQRGRARYFLPSRSSQWLLEKSPYETDDFMN